MEAQELQRYARKNSQLQIELKKIEEKAKKLNTQTTAQSQQVKDFQAHLKDSCALMKLFSMKQKYNCIRLQLQDLENVQSDLKRTKASLASAKAMLVVTNDKKNNELQKLSVLKTKVEVLKRHSDQIEAKIKRKEETVEEERVMETYISSSERVHEGGMSVPNTGHTNFNIEPQMTTMNHSRQSSSSEFLEEVPRSHSVPQQQTELQTPESEKLDLQVFTAEGQKLAFELSSKACQGIHITMRAFRGKERWLLRNALPRLQAAFDLHGIRAKVVTL